MEGVGQESRGSGVGVSAGGSRSRGSESAGGGGGQTGPRETQQPGRGGGSRERGPESQARVGTTAMLLPGSRGTGRRSGVRGLGGGRPPFPLESGAPHQGRPVAAVAAEDRERGGPDFVITGCGVRSSWRPRGTSQRTVLSEDNFS